VVVDNYQDAIIRSTRVGNVDVQRTGLGFGQQLANQLHSEFGLSLHLESQRGDEKRNIMLDFGLPTGALENNLAILKIDPASVDALVVSHGHFDHFGGLLPFLKQERPKMRGDLPLYVGGEDTFCYRWVQPPSGDRVSAGVLDRRELAAANVRLVMADRPMTIGGHAFTTGPVPRTSFEKIFPAFLVEIGTRDGAGCDSTHFSKEEQDGKIVADQFRGEHTTCFNVKDRGLVVVSSCGHSGIINAVRQAQMLSGVQKVHAVMGGFHLAPAPDAYIGQVVAGLKEIDPDYIVPMHCSGAAFSRAVAREMPDKLIASYTGTRFVFGA
jgi:7,8-dihydropterin-6-yl-methyl-4-(beta-D-ribofuranosyl)aminobenzene 5'-phosphate synthase